MEKLPYLCSATLASIEDKGDRKNTDLTL